MLFKINLYNCTFKIYQASRPSINGAVERIPLAYKRLLSTVRKTLVNARPLKAGHGAYITN